MKRNWILFALAGGVVALLCMTRTQRTQSGTAGVPPLESALPEGSERVWRRAASQPTRLPARLNELESLAAGDASAGIEAMEEFLRDSDDPARVEAFAWLIDQPAAAARWIDALPDGPVRNGIIERILSKLARQNPIAALATADLLATPDLRDAALTSVLRQWAGESPVDALNAIVAREEWRDSPLVGRAFVAAATSFPRQIKELLTIIPAGSLDSSFLAAAAESLLAKDPGAIPLWFESVRTAEQRSAIAEAVVLHAGRSQPELAFIWATQLSDPAHRTDSLRTLMHKTAQRDPELASELFDSPWLSSEDREAISRIPNPRLQ